MIKEFKTFISRGNVVDLAVGVIIGGAFQSIVSSLVNDVLMPLIGIILGGVDFSNLAIHIGSATIKYGMFIQQVIDFLIVAFCVFMFVKTINELASIGHKKEEEQEKVDTELSILQEIRDELKKQNKTVKKAKKKIE